MPVRYSNSTFFQVSLVQHYDPCPNLTKAHPAIAPPIIIIHANRSIYKFLDEETPLKKFIKANTINKMRSIICPKTDRVQLGPPNAKANYIGVEQCCLPGSGLIRVVSTNPGYASAKSGPNDQLLRFRMWRSKTGLMMSSSESPADSKQSVASYGQFTSMPRVKGVNQFSNG